MMYFNFDIPTQPNEHKLLGNVLQGADSLVIAEIVRRYDGLIFVMTPDVKSAVCLEKILTEFTQQPVTFFPDWETLPYDNFSPHQEIISARLSALFQLQHSNKGIFIAPITTVMQRVCPAEFLQHNVLLIKRGDRLNIERFRLQLENAVIEQSNKYWNMANLQYEVLYWIYFRWEVRCLFDWIFLMMKLIVFVLLM